MMTAKQLAKMIAKFLPVETHIREVTCINNNCAVFFHTDPGIHTVEKATQISVTQDGNYKILDLPHHEQS